MDQQKAFYLFTATTNRFSNIRAVFDHSFSYSTRFAFYTEECVMQVVAGFTHTTSVRCGSTGS